MTKPLVVLMGIAGSSMNALVCAQEVLVSYEQAYELRGLTPNGLFGDSFGLGDVNGDSLPDLIVGAPNHLPNNEGQVSLFSGVDGAFIDSFVGQYSGMRLGRSVAGFGDLDGDGFDEFAVGATEFRTDGFPTRVGLVHVRLGMTHTLLYEYVGGQTDAAFGYVEGLGDVDNDGTLDFGIGAPEEIVGIVPGPQGRYRVYSGATGLLVYEHTGDIPLSSGVTTGWRFGQCSTGVGDVNDDGHDDYVVAAPGDSFNVPRNGMVRCFSGFDHSLIWTYRPLDTEWLGFSLDTIGDLNGDGASDIVAGSFAWSESRGRVRVLSGQDGSILLDLLGTNPGDEMGQAVAGVGDWNNDGVPDFVVGSRLADVDGMPDVGRVVVYSGADLAQLLAWEGSEPGERFGNNVASADLNGDQFPDLIVNAQFGGSGNEGVVRVLMSFPDCGDEDCDANGVGDKCQIMDDPTADANGNGVLDHCEIELLDCGDVDCNNDGVGDACQIMVDARMDANRNGLLDLCEIEAGMAPDTDNNGVIDGYEHLYTFDYADPLLPPNRGVSGSPFSPFYCPYPNLDDADAYGSIVVIGGDNDRTWSDGTAYCSPGWVYGYDRETGIWSRLQSPGQLYGDRFGDAIEINDTAIYISDGGYEFIDGNFGAVWSIPDIGLAEADPILNASGGLPLTFLNLKYAVGEYVVLHSFVVGAFEDAYTDFWWIRDEDGTGTLIYERPDGSDGADGELPAIGLSDSGRLAVREGNTLTLYPGTDPLAAPLWETTLTQSGAPGVGEVRMFAVSDRWVVAPTETLGLEVVDAVTGRYCGLIENERLNLHPSSIAGDHLITRRTAVDGSYQDVVVFDLRTLQPVNTYRPREFAQVLDQRFRLNVDRHRAILTASIFEYPGYQWRGGVHIRNLVLDCDNDLVPDYEEISADPGLDQNGNGVLDSCEGVCIGDANGDKSVDFSDLDLLLDQWGAAVIPGSGSDLNGDGLVNFQDLDVLLDRWGQICS